MERVLLLSIFVYVHSVMAHDRDRDDICLIQLKFQKLLSKYEYVDTEYQETMYLFKLHKAQFDADCCAHNNNNNNNKNHNQPQPQTPDIDATDNPTSTDTTISTDLTDHTPPQQQQQPHTHNADGDSYGSEDTQDTQDTQERTPYSELIKKLYKLLSLKTHPDKAADYDESTFIEVQDAYKKNDVLKLFNLARRCGLDTYIKKDIAILYTDREEAATFEAHVTKCIEYITTQINDVKSTLAWNWAYADDAKKNEYRTRYNL